MSKLHCFLLLFFPIVLFAEDGWNEQTSGISDNINSIYFFNASSGFAAGNNGQLIETTDGGANWSAGSVTSLSNFQKIYFKNSTDGYLLTQDGKLHTTSNSGNSWSVQTLDIHGLNGIHFNGNNGVIVGDDGNVFTSTDGTSWTKQSSLGVFTINDVVFFNDTIVVAVGAGGELHRSINKGLTWNPVSHGITNTLSAIKKLNNETVLIAGNKGTMLEYEPISGIIKPVAVGLSSAWLKGISCNEVDVCHVVGSGSTVLIKNVDTWVTRNLDDVVNLNAVQFINEHLGFVAGISGVIYQHDKAGFPNSFTPVEEDQIKIYPIPVEQHLTIEHSTLTNAKISITNAVGQLVYFSKANSAKKVINTSLFLEGVYFIHITRNGSLLSSKFIKK